MVIGELVGENHVLHLLLHGAALAVLHGGLGGGPLPVLGGRRAARQRDQVRQGEDR